MSDRAHVDTMAVHDNFMVADGGMVADGARVREEAAQAGPMEV
jgi:hypothetical protein